MHNFEPDFDGLKGTVLGWARDNAVELAVIAACVAVVVFAAVFI